MTKNDRAILDDIHRQLSKLDDEIPKLERVIKCKSCPGDLNAEASQKCQECQECRGCGYTLDDSAKICELFQVSQRGWRLKRRQQFIVTDLQVQCDHSNSIDLIRKSASREVYACSYCGLEYTKYTQPLYESLVCVDMSESVDHLLKTEETCKKQWISDVFHVSCQEYYSAQVPKSVIADVRTIITSYLCGNNGSCWCHLTETKQRLSARIKPQQNLAGGFAAWRTGTLQNLLTLPNVATGMNLDNMLNFTTGTNNVCIGQTSLLQNSLITMPNAAAGMNLDNILNLTTGTNNVCIGR